MDNLPEPHIEISGLGKLSRLVLSRLPVCFLGTTYSTNKTTIRVQGGGTGSLSVVARL